MIQITDSAVHHLHALLVEKQAAAGTGLRLFVERGGCAGLQYGMKLDQPAEGDEIVTRDGASLLVDAASLPYLKEVELDYEDTLSDAGFKIRNPLAARSCGCGTSFEPAPAVAGEVAAAPPVPDGEACAGSDPD